MPVVTIGLHSSSPSAALLKDLRSATRLPLLLVRDALLSGSALLHAHLYFNDHEEQAAALRGIAEVARRHDLEVEVHFVEDDEPGPVAGNRISVAALEAILQDWEHRLAAQRLR